MMKNTFLILLLVVVTLLRLGISFDLDRLINKSAIIENRYIAVLKSNCTEKDIHHVVGSVRGAQKDGLSGAGSVKNFSTLVYLTSGIVGFVFDGDPASVDKVKAMDMVENVEHDQLAQGQQAVDYINPEWYLDRIDQRSATLDNSYYPKYTGEGSDIYILDSGIYYNHDEFRGRAFYGGYDAIDQVYNTNRNGWDCNGHGTHVAALAGGKNYGVAKKSHLYSIRVLDCQIYGPFSAIISAIDYVIVRIKNQRRKAVVSMSLAGAHSPALNAQVLKMVNNGIPVVVAAGNAAKNACNYSPASASTSGVITVGGTKEYRDNIYFASNYGPCVTIMAPGQTIVSAKHTCRDCSTTKSGTSMSTPLVSGAIALLQQEFPTYTVAQLKSRLILDSTKNAVDMSDFPSNHKTFNRLLFVQNAASTTTVAPTTRTTTASTTSPPTTASTASPSTTTSTISPPTAIPKPVLLPRTNLSTYNRPKIFELLLATDIENYYFYQVNLNYTLMWLNAFEAVTEYRFIMVLNDKKRLFTESIFQVDKQQLNFNIERFKLDGFHLHILAPYSDSAGVTKYMAIFYKNDIETKVFLGDSLQMADKRMTSLKREDYELKYFLNEPGGSELSYASVYIKSPNVSWIKYNTSSLSALKSKVAEMEGRGYFVSCFDATNNFNFTIIFNSRQYGSGLYKYIFDQSRDQFRKNVDTLAKDGWQPTLIAMYEIVRYTRVYLTIFWK